MVDFPRDVTELYDQIVDKNLLVRRITISANHIVDESSVTKKDSFEQLIPNIIYAVKNQGKENNCKCVVINAIEQIGRYSSMALMCVPLLVWEFGFQSVADMILYFMCDTVLLVAYLIIWRFYFIRPTLKIALCLAILPTLIFLISGVLLRHWLLVVAAVLFGIGHIYITVQNHK